MITKYAAAAPTGVAVTISLLFVMQALISLESGAAMPERIRIPTTWHRVPIDEKVNVEIFERPELPELPDQPEPPPYTDHSDSGPKIPVHRAPPLPGDGGVPLQDPWSGDGPLMAVVRIRPVYPAAAQQRGLEGYVRVEFDVLASGSVVNVRVIESSSAIFERSAIRAAQGFRFKARVVDGVPQPSSAVQYQFRFTMDE